MVFMPEGLVPGLGRLTRRLRVGAPPAGRVAVTATGEEIPP